MASRRFIIFDPECQQEEAHHFASASVMRSHALECGFEPEVYVQSNASQNIVRSFDAKPVLRLW